MKFVFLILVMYAACPAHVLLDCIVLVTLGTELRGVWLTAVWCVCDLEGCGSSEL